jgi:hypothetical protein
MRHPILVSTVLLCLGSGYAFGSCTASSPYTCTGGSFTIPANNQTGSLGSNSQTVSGLAGTITKVTLTLNTWTDNFTDMDGQTTLNPGDADREMMLVFTPTGCNSNTCRQAFQFLGGFGEYESLSSYEVTFDDSATNYAPDFFEGGTGDKLASSPATYKPTVNEQSTYCSGNGGQAAFGSPAPSSAPCANDNTSDPSNEPTVSNPATFASQFNGSSPNGTWTLYVWSWAGGEDAHATISSWFLTITTQVNVTNTTTSLSSDQTNNEAFEGNSVSLTATVSPTPDGGTVDFTDNGNTIGSCGSVAVSGGTATCHTSFSTEGYHPLEATYSGDTNFGISHGNLNFFVDHTTSNPSSGVFCNTGTITINTSSQPGTTPYPQHIFVPTTSFSISDISLTLNSISTPDGIAFFNFLLVDPNGNKFVPMAGTGGNGSASNVTLTLSDSGATTVPDNTSGAVPRARICQPTPTAAWSLTRVRTRITSPAARISCRSLRAARRSMKLSAARIRAGCGACMPITLRARRPARSAAIA